MKDNFDLKKYLTENKTIENSNKYLASSINEDEKKDELRAKIREMILKEMDGVDYSMEEDIYEAKDDEDEEEFIEDEEVEDEEVDVVDSEDMPEEGEMEEEPIDDEGGVMGHLEAAMEAARALGDEKLIDQLGNTITFYTRQHIAK